MDAFNLDAIISDMEAVAKIIKSKFSEPQFVKIQSQYLMYSAFLADYKARRIPRDQNTGAMLGLVNQFNQLILSQAGSQ